jgi:thioredoxin-like negative regulator of GroEL
MLRTIAMISRRFTLALILCCLVADRVPGQEIQWRHEYAAARTEADKKGLPLLIDFGTSNCFWCKKLDETTFRDPRIVAVLNEQFVPLKIDAERDFKLAQDLRISAFPTLVMAAPGGKILYHKEGFHDADTFHDILGRVANNTAAPQWMKQHLEYAQKAVEAGEYARAFASLKAIIEDSQGRSIHAAAQTLLGDIDAKANERISRAKDLLNAGKSAEAVQALTETILAFPGLPAARDAGDLLARVAQGGEHRQHARAKRAAELLAQAQDFYKSKDIVPCLDRCEILLASYGDLPEGAEASRLLGEIRNNQEWLQLAADTLADRLAGVYLAMADTLVKRGQPRDAEAYLRRVIQAFPGTRYAESAQIRIAQIQGIPANRVEITHGQ